MLANAIFDINFTPKGMQVGRGVIFVRANHEDGHALTRVK
jgi:hypothetical protein